MGTGKSESEKKMSRTDVVMCERIVALTHGRKLAAGVKARIRKLVAGGK